MYLQKVIDRDKFYDAPVLGHLNTFIRFIIYTLLNDKI